VAAPEPVSLLPLAESIADGVPVDWDAAEAHAGSADEQAIIRQLRVVANLAVLHRTLPEVPARPAAVAPERRVNPTPAIGNWGHLALVERLGSGSAGEVYRAWDRQLECEVALKLLHSKESADDPQLSPLVKEGRLLARVRHTNVITVHGVAIHDERFGLWMELIRGATLEQHLLKHGPFSAREAALIGIDLCRALAAIHAAGLIHRDVKAQNVMREDGGRIVLMDLGTGRETDSDRHRGLADLAGTPLYLAPEIFSGASASERTDLYSLGVLLYHLVTGSFPIRATSIKELTDGHEQGGGLRLRDARADLPTAFVKVIDRAMAKDAARYASAGAFEADLVQALDHPAPAFVKTDRAEDRARRLSWRRPALLVAAVALTFVVVGWPALRRRIPPASALAPGVIRSIAVLPMTNLSGDASQEYFVDGMTEALIDDLARIRALRVISRTSVMQYKGVNKRLGEIAKALNVDAVLEGSVMRFGDRVRISADLVDAASDRHVWVQSYERDVRDVLALQSDVAGTIARQIRIQVTPREQAGFARALAPIDPAVYDAYLQGRYYWNKRRRRELQTALAYFEQAVSLDPGFAQGYAGLADTYNLLIGTRSPAATYPEAKAAALRALELDPTLADPHASLAFSKFVFDRDLPGAEDEFKRAIELNPNYATAHHWYADYLSAMNRPLDAKREIEIARMLDPLSSAIRITQGAVFYVAREYDKAIAHFRLSLQLQPGDSEVHYYLGLAYAQKGMLSDATAELRQAVEGSGRSQANVGGAAFVAAIAGRRADALRMIEELQALSSKEWVDPEDFAAVYGGLGDADNAIRWLRKAAEDRSPGLMWAAVDPMLDPLRSDLRFVELVRSLGLAP
jgi:TolB-like protein/tetratricopeptide (TPR) repeat protein